MPAMAVWAQSFDPTNLSEISLWLDADDPTTLTNSTSASPPALGNIADGSNLGRWFDKSGGTDNIWQVYGSYNLVYLKSTSHLAGHGSVRFYDPTDTPTTGNGPYLLDAAGGFHTTANGSNTVLVLGYQYSPAIGSYQSILTNNGSGNTEEWLMVEGGNFDRYEASSTASAPAGTVHAYVYTYNSSNNNEQFYVDSAVSPAYTATVGRPAAIGNPYFIGGTPFSNQSCFGGEIYQVITYTRVLTNGEIAQILAYWNSVYGLSFNASAGALTAPNIAATAVGKTTASIAASSPSGGTGPYTTQIYRSTTSGTAASIAISGNTVSGATGLTLSDTGLSTQTNYYYTMKVTDNVGAVVYSNVLGIKTHGTTTVGIAYLGDSIGYGALVSHGVNDPAVTLTNALQAAYPALDVQMYNASGDGNSISQYSTLRGSSALASIISTAHASGDTYFIIELGTNDWGQYNLGTSGYNQSTYIADINNVINQLTSASPPFKVYVNQMIFRGDITAADDPSVGLQPYNTALTGLTYGTTVRQGYTAGYAFFKANQSELADALHPNIQGSLDMGNQTAVAIGPSLANDFGISSPATVTSVVVSPSTATVSGAATQQFSAIVTGTGSPSQTVTWSATAGTIDSSGNFTASASTGSTQTITITATSTLDNTKSGTATVTIAAATSSSVLRSRSGSRPRVIYE